VKKILLVLSIVLFNGAFAQAPAIQWQKSFGGSSYDMIRQSHPMVDGGIIHFGHTNSNDGDITGNHGESDLFLFKTDSSGNVLWQKIYGGSADEFAEYFWPLSGNTGYLLAANSYSNDGNVIGHHGVNSDAWIIVVNNSGDIIWQKCIGTTGHEMVRTVLITSEGGYLLVGEKDIDINPTPEITNMTTQYWITKLDASGNVVWEKTYGGSEADYGTHVMQFGNQFLVVGQTPSHDGDVAFNHSTTGNGDIWLIALSESNGEMLWQRSFGGTNDEQAYKIEPAGAGFAILGYSLSENGDVTENNGSADVWLLKTDYNGDLIWQQSFGGSAPDYAYQMWADSDGDFLISGETKSNNGDATENHGDYDAWVLKVSPTGALLWQKQLGGSLWDNAFTIFPTDDNGYLVTGAARSNDGDLTENNGQRDFWMVKLGVEGLSSDEYHIDTIVLSPNPATTMLRLVTPANSEFDAITIVDMTGKVVLSHEFVGTVDISGLSAGHYVLKAHGRGKLQHMKFIKQ
jgi:hypothetical protein